MRSLFCGLSLFYVAAHEYLGDPPARTGTGVLSGFMMGETACDYGNGVQQCGGAKQTDPDFVLHHFRYNSDYTHRACGGSTDPRKLGYDTPFIQDEGDVSKFPHRFDMNIAGPSKVTTFKAGSTVTVRFNGFFHQGVIRLAMCFENCNDMKSYDDYVLGYWFTEGTAGPSNNIYGVELYAEVKLPNRAGNATLQYLTDAEVPLTSQPSSHSISHHPPTPYPPPQLLSSSPPPRTLVSRMSVPTCRARISR
jgi:hypothetical protein